MTGRTGIIYRLIICCLFASTVAGCKTSSAPKSLSSIPVVEGTAAGADTSYRLQVGDGIAVHFFSFPDLDDTATIGPDGRISLRLISDFPIAGMTLSEASKDANERFEKAIRHPGVTITIKSYALQQIFVDGEVNNPGIIRSSIPLTVSGAIAQAGGIKLATAHSHGALLLRRRPDGAVVYYKLDFRGDLPGGDGDPILRTNDLIYVPRTAIATVADFIQANLTRLVPVNVTYSIYHTF